MGLPRSQYVRKGEEGVYHCFSRCVRRAFLYGFDAVTGRDCSHRKGWLVDRLRQLAGLFAIDVCAYAVMGNHYHTVLRTRPDIVAGWSDVEVARRWVTLFPKTCGRGRKGVPTVEEQIGALEQCPERLAELRERLCSLSWFMGRLNEFIARAANREDEVKGRFWESRFKCQALLDEAATAACMVYVDLNPVRAGMAESPEDSSFTSIEERIRAWRAETTAAAAGGSRPAEAPSGSENSAGVSAAPGYWLCPVGTESDRRGILSMTAEEYFDLVDKSWRMTRLEKGGAIEAGLGPVLRRIGAVPEAWPDTISRFGGKFHLAAGRLCHMRGFAGRLGRRWLKGVSAARAAFAPPVV